MHNYIPNNEQDVKEMLDFIGVSSMEKLFEPIPDNLKLKRALQIPDALSEYEVLEKMKALASKNVNAQDKVCFMGGGVYDHYIPAAIPQLVLRQEFYTSYTPYQAEISQGTLMSIFEFQTYISRLTGTDIANASVYDGGNACAEAMFMATNTNDKDEIIILKSVNEQYTETCKTYAKFRNIKIVSVNHDEKTGQCDLDALKANINENTSAILVQSPNFFGIIEDIEKISNIAKEKDIVLIVANDPISLGMLKPAGQLGADIVVGEGQSLGIPMNFGGPGIGFLACKKEFLRKLPGRIVGETTDKEGRRGFVMTMQAREQHIRREKATSNICSNQALCALTASMYMSFMGKEGMKNVAELCFNKANYMKDKLVESKKFKPLFTGTSFKEFAVSYEGDVSKLISELNKSGYLAGISLEKYGYKNALLIAVTEKRTKAQIDDFVGKAVSI